MPLRHGRGRTDMAHLIDCLEECTQRNAACE
ncbi:hypothetical protein BP1258A_1242 [Burkholderia pseudomallei 1258a]|uniref:Uncharacterized protein n=1 Tax=Burkholderia pseudomallei (strain 1026b) TaxID=884204 RepID=A0A0H3HJU8_BURP2|nr:hypothetical protein BP1026B_I1568 [Burkholderia pseudomallei 1026b]EIF52816.1 hypothetical protein BP1026A_6278 [Burkholderia pseudomallei 1026a]EIF66323.1 hypothetical protein BP1258A_1242 [Burkholderia pseudomallei 1258a]EIF68116.1 hypothetical protein BP1258B_1335 [Burkholderia pseudomallei 1258b]EIF77082.1 hypothetical protein BP354E_1146 [Burkholderia pseudomallei 354e]EIF81316.1 hypothetical protein BP354A_1491 [Burkholderia pseudomallei 354a]